MKPNKDKTEGMWLGKFSDEVSLRSLNYDNNNTIKWIPPDELLRSLGTMLTIDGDTSSFWNNKLKYIFTRRYARINI